MTALLWILAALLAIVLGLACDLFLLHRGLREVGPDAKPFWIRTRSWWNIVLGGHEGVSIDPSSHYRLRSATEKVEPRFCAHEWRHIFQQRGGVPTVHTGGFFSWLWKYQTDPVFRAAAEADAVAFGESMNTNPFWVAVAGRVNHALGLA